MTPAPDTGRTAEENEKAALVDLLQDHIILRDAGWMGENSFVDGFEEAADALIAGPLAHLRAENANLRDRVREAEGAGRDPDGSELPSKAEAPSDLRPTGGYLSRSAQPIATAPKFLGQILLYGNLKGSREKAWHIGKWFRCGSYGGGWWISSSVEVEATHWAALPIADFVQASVQGPDDEPRCTATGNPCGTDTVMAGRQCPDDRWGGRCAHRIAEAAKFALLTQEEGR